MTSPVPSTPPVDTLAKKLEDKIEALRATYRHKSRVERERAAIAYLRDFTSDDIITLAERYEDQSSENADLRAKIAALEAERDDAIERAHVAREAASDAQHRAGDMSGRALAAESCLSTSRAEVERLREALELYRNAGLIP